MTKLTVRCEIRAAVTSELGFPAVETVVNNRFGDPSHRHDSALFFLKIRYPGRFVMLCFPTMTASQITPKSLSRAVNRLKPFGVSTHGSSFMIADLEALRRFCGAE